MEKNCRGVENGFQGGNLLPPTTPFLYNVKKNVFFKKIFFNIYFIIIFYLLFFVVATIVEFFLLLTSFVKEKITPRLRRSVRLVSPEE